MKQDSTMKKYPIGVQKFESDWTPRPVLRFDFNSGLYDSVENLRGCKVYKIGVNFSSRIRGIKDWKIVG